MIAHPILRQFLILGTRTAVIAIRINGDPAARSKDARHLYIFGIHQLYQVFHDDIHAIFMKITVITETEQIQFQTLALHHFHIGKIGDTDLRKVGLSCNRTQTGKFGAVETYPIVVSGMLVHKGLQHFGSIILLVLGLRPEKGLFSIFMFPLSCFGEEIPFRQSLSFHPGDEVISPR